MEVALTQIHKRSAECLYDVVVNALDTLLLAVILSTLLHSIFCPIMLTPSS